MLAVIKRTVLSVHQANGVEVCLLPDNRMAVHTATIKLEKSKIKKEAAYHGLTGLEEVAKKLDVSVPVSLAISGKGVLFKRIATTEMPPDPVEFVLPAARREDFHLETVEQGAFTFIAIIRKDVLNRLLETMTKMGFKILSVSLAGISDLTHLAPLIDASETGLFTGCYRFVFDANHLVTNVKMPDPGDPNEKVEYNIGDQYIYSPSMVAFGGASGLAINGPDAYRAPGIETIEKNRKEYIYFKWFRAAAWTVLVGFFGLLLANFFVYNYYFSKNKELSMSHSLTMNEFNSSRSLSEEIKKKERFLERTGWKGSLRISFFADRIASMVPAAVTLTSMKVYPVQLRDFMANEMTAFKKDTIEITGTCDDPTQLENFTENLKTIRECKTVSLRNYSYKRETGIGSFAMDVITK